jgi:hypothetical protein
MCDMVTVGEKSNILKLRLHISTSMSSALDLLTLKSLVNIFLQWVVYMCDMVTLSGKDNCLQPRNRISTLMSSAPVLSPFDLKINREHLFLWVVFMCDTVTLGGKVKQIRYQF